MIKRYELQGPSCLTRAADDEPIFVLRANDELAPHLVVAWASMYATAKQTPSRKMTAREKRKYFEALDLAEAMQDWKRRRGAT